MGIQLHGINLIDKVLSLVAKRNINTEIQIMDKRKKPSIF